MVTECWGPGEKCAKLFAEASFRKFREIPGFTTVLYWIPYYNESKTAPKSRKSRFRCLEKCEKYREKMISEKKTFFSCKVLASRYFVWRLVLGCGGARDAPRSLISWFFGPILQFCLVPSSTLVETYCR